MEMDGWYVSERSTETLSWIVFINSYLPHVNIILYSFVHLYKPSQPNDVMGCCFHDNIRKTVLLVH